MNVSNGSGSDDQSAIEVSPFRPLLVVVEGLHDVGFIKHISKILHQTDTAVPDLDTLESERRIAVVSLGGGGSSTWSHRFASLHLREFHLVDREIYPETENRIMAAIATNCRPGCRAILSNRRGMENYLSVQAVNDALGIDVTFGPDDDVAAVVARRIFESGRPLVHWDGLMPSARKRLREHAKRLLNTRVLARMTVEQLELSDGAEDFRRWLGIIAEMIG